MDCVELFQGIARNTLSSTGIILDTNFLVFAENFFQCLCFSKGFMTRGDSGVAGGDEEGRYQATASDTSQTGQLYIWQTTEHSKLATTFLLIKILLNILIFLTTC